MSGSHFAFFERKIFARITKCESLSCYKCNGLLWQSATACLPQCATSVITKCDKCYYKARQLVHCNVRQVLLQSVTSVITKCDKCYYKIWQVLSQSVTSVITKCDRKLSHLPLFLIPEFIFFALNFFQVSPSASVRRAIHNPPHLLGHSAESKC